MRMWQGMSVHDYGVKRVSIDGMTIAQFAAAGGVGVETVRFYHGRGLLPLPHPPAGSKVRRYGSAHLARLRFVRRAQQLGFTLDEVAALLELDDGRSCGPAREIAEQKLADVERRLADLRVLQRQLRSIIERCRTTSGTVRCPLIAALGSER